MSNHPFDFVYNTNRVATLLSIGRSTVNRYCRSLEDVGYVFMKENSYRSFTEHDLSAFRSLIELLARGMDYDNAILTVFERYNSKSNSVSLAVAAHTNSDQQHQEVAILNQKMDELLRSVSMLSDRMDQIIDERVRSEVAVATSHINHQVEEITEEIREVQIRSNQKLDEILTRMETHGRKKRFLGLF